MIEVEDWAEIRRLHRADGLPVKQIARIKNVSRNTVRAALRSDGPPKYEREPKGSVADGFEPRIRELLAAYPTMPASVIADRIGWPYADRTLRTRVAELRPVYLPPDPASRTSYAAGELAQDDFWFPDITVPVGYGQVRTAKQLPVLTMVCGYSRWASAVLIPSRNAEDLYAGWWQLIQGLGGVPRLLVWDGEGAVGRHPDRLTAECQGFRGTWRPGCMCAGPRTRRRRGWWRGSMITWSGRSCLAASSRPRLISTPSWAWVAKANTRWHRRLECRPADRIAADKAAMIALPPVPPVPPACGWHKTSRLPRDYYVRLDGNDYSVDPAVIGRRIEVTADLGRVRALCDGRVVADHERCWAKHQTLTDPAHLQAAQALRSARRLAVVPVPRADEVEQRDLAVYDQITGQGVA